MKLKEEKISSQHIFSGKVFDIDVDKVRLPDDNIATREVVKHNGGVAILATTKDGNVLMVRQYRYGIGRETLELPAGKLEKDEDPKECGIRELREETGYTANKFDYLTAMYSSPGFCSEKIYIYQANDLTSGKQDLDQGEFVNVEEVSLAKAVEMCLDGRIADAKTIVGILTYNKFNER